MMVGSVVLYFFLALHSITSSLGVLSGGLVGSGSGVTQALVSSSNIVITSSELVDSLLLSSL